MPDSTTTAPAIAAPRADWQPRLRQAVRDCGLNDETLYESLYGDDEMIEKDPQSAVNAMAAAANWIGSQPRIMADILEDRIGPDQPSIELAALELAAEVQEQMNEFAKQWGIEPPIVEPFLFPGDDFIPSPDHPEHGEFWGAIW